MAYEQSLRLDSHHIDAKYNLDRVLRLLPENAVAKDEQEKLGIVMGNIPSGLGAQIREDMSVRVTQLILRNVNQVIATPF